MTIWAYCTVDKKVCRFDSVTMVLPMLAIPISSTKCALTHHLFSARQDKHLTFSNPITKTHQPQMFSILRRENLGWLSPSAQTSWKRWCSGSAAKVASLLWRGTSCRRSIHRSSALPWKQNTYYSITYRCWISRPRITRTINMSSWMSLYPAFKPLLRHGNLRWVSVAAYYKLIWSHVL